MTVFTPQTDDEREEILAAKILAERIGYVTAREGSKGRRRYARLIINQLHGEPVVDPDDQYRLDDGRLDKVERALQMYEQRHGVTLARGRIYVDEDFPVACCPNAVESDLVGITVHVRRTPETYEAAVQEGLTLEMQRHGQAMMAVSGLEMWVHLNYYEHGTEQFLAEHDMTVRPRRAAELLDELYKFAAKTRQVAAERAA